jgi:hypothetical protein
MMFRFVSILWIALFSAIGVASAETQRVVFEGTVADHKWSLKSLNPELPFDWSSYEYLVLEFKASSPQRFFLRVYNVDGMRSMWIHPLGGGVWIRAAVPLRYFRRPEDGNGLNSVSNRAQHSYWLSLRGPFGPLDAVESIGVTMEYPIGKPTLEIRSVRLSKEDPGSEVLDGKPVVDEFGQWIPDQSPRKVKNLEQLKKEWAEEEKALRPGDFNYCSYGGYLGTQAKATGFFRVEQVDGKWWFIDPDGHFFLSVGAGASGMGPGAGRTVVEGRESYYAALPPANVRPSTPARSGGGGRGFGFLGGASVSFYSWNLFRRFDEDWETKWAELAIRRMEAWGFNMGPGRVNKVWEAKPKPYLMMLGQWQGTLTSFLSLTDVYSPDFPRIVDEAAATRMAALKNDPYLVGYFIGNEPAWPGRESECVDRILAGPDTATQCELKAFLREGDNPERRKTFVMQAFERYIQVVNAAARKYDPNHLNLGIRFGRVPPDDVIRMGRFFDVTSHNIYYRYDPSPLLQKIYKLTGRPILIGEYHFCTPGYGLAAGLTQVRNQEERGVAYRYYLEHAAAVPAFVGADWFQFVDQSVTAMSNGENYNLGFVDVTDRQYRELVEASKLTHKRLPAVHAGKEPPVAREPLDPPFFR